MEQASSSKVTVEYHDPFNVYQLLSPGLLPRLPLRNLHWESHSGPLRSINSLHIDLISAGQPRSPSTSSNAELSRVKSSETSSDDGFRVQNLGAVTGEQPDLKSGKAGGPEKGRRHQIPGLRQTPYLKVFFLRCDDNETYKATARKQVREWIKEHTPPASSAAKVNSQENHDAFEWLIVHIVVPNTAAATQPKTATKGTTPLLEKLRADFNSTSKNSVDRICQIRIGVNDVPYDILPRVVPAIPGSNSYTETKQEHEESWIDLVSKLKALILSSFDMRVSQYEEDVKEKDAQRALPGWNFCTFFVLKEGLARGFENVGLVEDALVGYDELSLGLDIIVRDQATPGVGAVRGNSFLPFTSDLKGLVESTKLSMLKEQGVESENDGPIDLQGSEEQDLEDEIPLTASRKNYRELVLSNDISIFDFRCYIFARQLSLLLRLGNASISKEELLTKLKEQRESNLQGVAARSVPSQPPDEAENLSVLSEVCKRAVAFIAIMTRLMREDMEAAQIDSAREAHTSGLDTLTLRAIDNIVSSFTFSVSQQILAQTSTKSLPIPPSTLAPPSETPGQEPKTTIPEPKTMMHPARSSSLLTTQSSKEPLSPGIFPGGMSDQAPATKSSSFLKPGLEELAAHRAELYLMSRGVLEHLGLERGWSVGWDEASDLVGGAIDQMTEISLSDDAPATPINRIETIPSVHGMSSSLLKVALSSQDDFCRLYETLTDKALRHYTVASHGQSVQTAMADLAVLKYRQGDHAAAASYFYRMTPAYGENGWENIEMNMLVMYARCLKELKRNDEFVKVTLKLLANAAAQEKTRLTRKTMFTFDKSGGNRITDTTNTRGYLTELLDVAKDVSHDVDVPLQSFFSELEVEGPAIYHESKDSFSLVLRLRYLLMDDLKIEKARVRLAPIDRGKSRDIWLESEDVPVFKKGLGRVQVDSSVMVPATYVVRQVIFQLAKITITYEADQPASSQHNAPTFFKSPMIRLFQRPKSLDIRLSPSRSLHLSRTRNLELVLSSGWNDVQSGELHIRGATAGLRLLTSELTQTSGNLQLSKNNEPGVITFGALPADQTVKLCLPYSMENEVLDISLKVEISYTTAEGIFFFADQLKVKIQLPLGVNVQDVFKHKALFSKFSISSATMSPLRILGSKLENSDYFEATHGASLSQPVTVFSKQPCTLLYKITKKSNSAERPILKVSKDKSSLTLVIYYVCVEEEIEDAVTIELSRALADTPHESYTKIIVDAISRDLHMRMLLAPIEFERTALLNELSISGPPNIPWTEFFVGLGKDAVSGRNISTILSEWLQAWCDSVSSISLRPLSIDTSDLVNARSISIPVDIPSITVLHTASLVLAPSTSFPTTGPGSTIAITNQVLTATLKIRSTRAWDTAPPDHPVNGSLSAAKELRFVYEVSAASDCWLLGGKRRGHFTLPIDASTSLPLLKFPVMMIPIKEGYLPLPNVDIRAEPAGSGKSGDDDEEGSVVNGGEEEATVTCETDYRNCAEVVRVISGARKTTVSLDASGPQGGAWLLESELGVAGAS